MPARDRAEARPRGHLRLRPADPDGGQGAPARAAAQAQPPGRLDRARPRRFDGAQARLPRRRHPSPARPGGASGTRGLRRGRAGAGRGDRLAAHGRRGRQSLGDARGPLPSRRQIRGRSPTARTRRSRTRRPDGARAAHRHQAAAGGGEDRRSLARSIEERAGARPRRASRRHREPARLRPPRARSPLLARDDRRGHARPRTTRTRTRTATSEDQDQSEGDADEQAEGERADVEISRRGRRRPRGRRAGGRRRTLGRAAGRRRGCRIRRRRPSRGARRLGANEPRGPDYRAFTAKFDEIVHAEDLCDAGRAVAAARLSRQAARAPPGRRRAAREPAAAPPACPAEPGLGVRSRGGDARSGAAPAHRHRPVPAALLQAGEGHQLPRHRRDASPRQFGLDAGAADHGRGDLRRHPGPDARALRRQGRDPRLHDEGLEGRAVARALAAVGKARQSRPPQRSAPHRLQIRRRAVAAGAQEPRADDARGASQGEHRRRGPRLGAQAPPRPRPSSAAS